DQVLAVAANPPKYPRDLVYMPARLTLNDGQEGEVFLPALYPGTHEHPDEKVKLGRDHDWQAGPGEGRRGRGARLFLAGADLVSLNALSAGQRQEIGHLVALMVERYEPRLRDIHVSLIEGKESGEYTLRFHVDAKLAMDPAPAVAFDTILELATGRYSTATG